MQKRILITGGSGLLALNWAQATKGNMSVTLGLHQRSVDMPGVKSQTINLESINDLTCSLEEIGPDFVIHTAGLASVERCESDPHLAHHINVTLALNVAKACKRLGVGLVHISTDQLFSGEEPFISENHPVDPVNTYGKTKAEAENEVMDTYPQALVIRTNFYGWGTSYRHSFSDVIINALRSGSNLTLFKDFFYTPILIENLALAAHDLIDIKASGIFNVVGDDRTSKYQFGLKVAEKFGLCSDQLQCGILSEKASLVRRPHDMSLSNAKVSHVLGRKLGGLSEQLSTLRDQEPNRVLQ